MNFNTYDTLCEVPALGVRCGSKSVYMYGNDYPAGQLIHHAQHALDKLSIQVSVDNMGFVSYQS